MKKFTEQKDTQGNMLYAAEFVTHDLDLNFYLERVEKHSQDAPDFKVMMKSPVHGKYFEAGAAWSGKTKDNSPKISIELKDPKWGVMRLIAVQKQTGVWSLFIPEDRKPQVVEEIKEAA